MNPVRLSQRLVESRRFEFFIIAVILANGVLLGLETSPRVDGTYGEWLRLGNDVALGVFIVEALLKMLALWPRPFRYFRDGWNIFDFTVIVFALIPSTGQFAMVARLARLLRVVRLVSAVRDLRLIVAALVRSIPSVGHVIMLMSVVVYIYAIMGYHLFHQHDPENWRSLGVSVLTLFNIITLEGWTEIMYTAMAGVSLGVGVLRQLCYRGHLCCSKPVHSHNHQQPGRGPSWSARGRWSVRCPGRICCERFAPLKHPSNAWRIAWIRRARSEKQRRVTHVTKDKALFPWNCGQAMLCLL